MNQEIPPPGELVNVAGLFIHVQRSGHGEPTVVLEAGFGNDSLVWSLVQSQIATFTQVCSYDRAGMGWSTANPNLRDSDNISEELHSLLDAAGLPEPYILVGHSMGGLYVRQFARRYPEEVAGLILIDSAHENQNGRLPEAVRKLDDERDERQLEQFEALSNMSHEDILEAMRLPQGQVSPFPDQVNALRRDRARPEVFAAMHREFTELDDELNQGEAALGNFGDLPVLVLTAEVIEPDDELTDEQNKAMAQVLFDLQQELAGISTNSRQIKINCGHFIHVEQPDLVIDAVQRMVNHVRFKSPL